MRKKSSLVVAIALVMLIAFSATCLAAPAILVNGKAIKAKPNAAGMISAKAVYTAMGYKVTVAKNVMTIKKNKDTIVINAKGVTKNKKAVKGTIKAAKGDYLISYALIKPTTGVAATFDKKTVTVSIGKAAVAPAVKPEPPKPEGPKPPEVKPEPQKPAVEVPAGLTGAKADAYIALIGCKYTGSCKSNWVADLKELPIVGDLHVTVAATSNAKSTELKTKGVPMIFGGETNDSISTVPLKEVVSGDKDDLTAFLKSADVSVSGDVITISKATPTKSLITLLNKINDKLSWSADKLDLSCKITISGGAVKSIDITKLTGTTKGATGGDHQATITADLKY